MSDEPQIGIHIPQSVNEQARRYQAYVLLTESRQITIKEAAAELIIKGAEQVMPPDPKQSTKKK